MSELFQTSGGVRPAAPSVPAREHLLHALYEAAELEHNLMCTYLYAAFSLRQGTEEGLQEDEVPLVDGWRRTLLEVAREEMNHLTAVWNITTALGGAPRFGRDNFPLDPGLLPAGITVKLAPFDAESIQHFVHLERPAQSNEPEGVGFEPEQRFERDTTRGTLTPMALDYDAVGDFYAKLGRDLRAFAEHHGEAEAFSGPRDLQVDTSSLLNGGVSEVICLKTALKAFSAIVEQGEGAPDHSNTSHFTKFLVVRDQLWSMRQDRPDFSPAFPAAVNPVLRKPLRDRRVWIEDPVAVAVVDLANSSYVTMLRLLGYAYLIPKSSPEKALTLDLAVGLMHVMTLMGEQAARLVAGPSNPGCNAGMSFTSLRDASALPPSRGARRFFTERLAELHAAARSLCARLPSSRVERAVALLDALEKRSVRDLTSSRDTVRSMPAVKLPLTPVAAATPPTPKVKDGVEHVPGRNLTLAFDAKRCIHARFCVTGAPEVFLANVQGPWISPDATSTSHLVEIAHACPSGAIRYRRHDGGPEESPPKVNLITVREAGPYAVRADLQLAGVTNGYRATLCRCGASKNKPYCDGSHHEAGFVASGEPESGPTDMLADRAGPLSIEPQVDGPLLVRGNLELLSGTGRCVARLTQARLCRCGQSGNKPYCDGTHARVGFKSG